jgi:hypothetical protein
MCWMYCCQYVINLSQYVVSDAYMAFHMLSVFFVRNTWVAIKLHSGLMIYGIMNLGLCSGTVAYHLVFRMGGVDWVVYALVRLNTNTAHNK